jgi:hypothetical protein
MDKLSALWQGAACQDRLLQSYRSFHLTTQSALLVAGAGLTLSVICLDRLPEAALGCCLLLTVSLLAMYLLVKMKRLIRARSEDVDYYHEQIIAAEQLLPEAERVLTAFKVYQKYGRRKTDTHFQNTALTEKMIGALTEKGKGHTRRFLDKDLFTAFFLLWLCFNIMGTGWLVRLAFP